MSIKKCILTGEELTKDNDSRAHIIPSALGGNIKPKGILSNKANGILNDKFDSPLIKSLQSFMALLGAPPDRGSTQPTKMTAEDGTCYYVKCGENLIPTRPEFHRVETESGDIKYDIKARTIKEAKTLFGKIKKENPHLDIDEVSKKFQFEEKPIEGMLHQKLELGPNIFFPAAFVMASLYSASNGLNKHPHFIEFVNDFNESTLLNKENTATIPPDTFYWIPSTDWFSNDAEISHILVLFSDPIRQQTFFYVELFNLPGIAVLLPYDGNSEKLYSHGINITTGKGSNLVINTDKLKSISWKSTHPWEPNKLDSFFKLACQRVEKIIEYSQQRSQHHEIEKEIKEKLGELGDKILSAKEREEIMGIIINSYIKRILHT